MRNARRAYIVVRALDAAGNASGPSNEVVAIPHLIVGWANLQWPPTLNHTISAVNRTDNVYGQVWIDGVTNQPGATPGLVAQLGFGPDGSDPSGNTGWTWVDASFNTDAGNNDEFVASLLPDTTGVFDYAYRYSVTDGRDWIYADLDGIGNGYSPDQAGYADRQLERRHDRAGDARRPPHGVGLARRDRARLGCRDGRSDPLRLRGAPERDERRSVHDDRDDDCGVLQRHRGHRGPDILLRRSLGGHVVQSVRPLELR